MHRRKIAAGSWILDNSAPKPCVDSELMAPTISAPGEVDPVIRRLAHLARQAVAQNDLAAAQSLFEAVLGAYPGHPDASSFLILRSLEANDVQRALDIAQRALDAAPTADLHFLHGRALEASSEHVRARDAFARTYALEPRYFPALFYQGVQEEHLGMTSASRRTFHRALALAQQAGALDAAARRPADLQRQIDHAIQVLHDAEFAVMEAELAPVRERHGAQALTRIEQAIAMYLGDRATEWPHPLQRPTFMLIPGLEPLPWFEREDFPFLASIEQQTAAIREELLAILADESSLSPYVDMPTDAPAEAVWRSLNRSRAWSSYHLFRHGERIEAHCQRCPDTTASLESIPLMHVAEHSPEALFSLLKAGARIPPHTGVLNGRLTVHLPLVVPADCGALKVGGEARSWTEGRCLIFDDSFVHEAWNTSDQDRAVLIFDVWDPRLSQAEREAIAAVVPAIGRYNRDNYATDPTHETL